MVLVNDLLIRELEYYTSVGYIDVMYSRDGSNVAVANFVDKTVDIFDTGDCEEDIRTLIEELNNYELSSCKHDN